MLKISINTKKFKPVIVVILYIFRHVSPVTLPHCIFMDRIRISGASNTQNYENSRVQLQNLNVTILRPCDVRLLDLSTESCVNEGNTTAHLKLL